ncbi:T9SS C-terminal target domain-containing protein, partial [Pseudoxanthomonas sp. SGD-10]
MYHNATDNLVLANVCPIDVYVGETLVLDNLVPTIRKEKITECTNSEIEITAEEGKDVVISYRAETSGAQPIKNVYLNGFELNATKADYKARTPTPTHNSQHLDIPIGGGIDLHWEASPTAASHDVYFGTDSIAVANADRNSPYYKGNQALENTTYQVTNLYTGDTYYWRINEVEGSTIYKGNVWHFRTRQLAFPGAEGYGRFARGGRGGKVVYVTNLNDSGPGSFREAVTNNIGPRTIVFNVSGVINLKSRLVLNQSYVTIAGQTAPGKGIVIRSAPLGITGPDNIVRHLRVRLGAGTTYDGMGLTGSNNSIIDHCSISWTIDEGFSSRGGAKNITFQRSMIAEALNLADHSVQIGKEHGYAATIGGDVGSFHHNLLAHNNGRNWSLGDGLDGAGMYRGRMDIRNNVVYNWGSRTTDGGTHEVNFVNNYYKPGPATTHFIAFTLDHENIGNGGTQRAYFSGNVMPGRFDESNQEIGREAKYRNGAVKTYETFVDQPFFESYVTTQTAYQAYKNVLSDVGCNQPVFDE